MCLLKYTNNVISRHRCDSLAHFKTVHDLNNLIQIYINAYIILVNRLPAFSPYYSIETDTYSQL